MGFRGTQFFKIDHVQEEMKIKLAAMYVYDKALTWHQQFMKKYRETSLSELYEQEALKRFGAVFEDPMVELKNVKQTSYVQVYQDLFEVLLNRLELTESYLISLFVGGLKDEINMPIKMFKLTILADAFSMARMQEATTLLWNQVSNTLALPAPTQFDNRGDRYVPGHKCSGQLYYLEVIEETDNGCLEEVEEVCENNEECERDVNEVLMNENKPHISLNALSSLNSFQTLRVKGVVGKEVLHILVDCSSTHNFLYLTAAKKIGCKLRSTSPLVETTSRFLVMLSEHSRDDFKIYPDDVKVRYEHVALTSTCHWLTAAAVEFKRISLIGFRSCTSRSHYRSVSKQTTR
ncbi:reverse transcriptase, partial [Tanacetum coccineum]